jgi:hypothetical protein
MGESRKRESVVAAVAWIICANKPVYPLYVWYFVGSGALASAWTALAAPLYAAIAILAGRGSLLSTRQSLLARAALPAVGAADTIFATKLFGAGSGTEMFFAPCVMIAALSFDASERKVARALVAGIFGAFALLHGRYGAPWHSWNADELARFVEINGYAVASLMAYVGWRFAGIR